MIHQILYEESDDSDIEAPSFSPLSQLEHDDRSESSDEFDSNDEDESIAIPSVDIEEQPATVGSSWSGFKIVGDNVDYNIHSSFQRSDDTVRVKDRVDFSSLFDRAPCLSSLDYDVTSLLPSELDIDISKEEMAILISRLRLKNHN